MSWVFRQASGPQELEAIFRLRHRAFYKSEETHELVADQPHGIDVGLCDVTARHYAVFDEEMSPIACLRSVGWEYGPEAHAVRALLCDIGVLDPPVQCPPFPLLDYVNVLDLSPEVRNWIGRRGMTVEFGRVCRDPNLGKDGPRAFRFLCDGVLASEFCIFGIERAIGLSLARVAPIYELYGFTAAQIDVEFVSHRITARILSLERAKAMGNPASKRMALLSEMLRSEGQLTRPGTVSL